MVGLGSGEACRIKVGAAKNQGHRLLRLGLVRAGLQRGQAQGGSGFYSQFQLLPQPLLGGADGLVGQQQRVVHMALADLPAQRTDAARAQ